MLALLLLIVRLLRIEPAFDSLQQIDPVHRVADGVGQRVNYQRKAHVVGTWLAS
jgi:hypothetical protein